MTRTLAFFVTLRSPYSYLATDRVIALAKKHGLELDVKPVYPLAIRAPQFFSKGNPALLSYLRNDAERTAEMLGIPFDWPVPDPIVQDLKTSEIAQDQPHIRHLSRLLAAASQAGQGSQIYKAVGYLLFGKQGNWLRPGALKAAVISAGGDWENLNQLAETQPNFCDEFLSKNAQDLDRSGHWGTPTLVYQDQVFFGQDRIAMCDWFITQSDPKT